MLQEQGYSLVTANSHFRRYPITDEHCKDGHVFQAKKEICFLFFRLIIFKKDSNPGMRRTCRIYLLLRGICIVVINECEDFKYSIGCRKYSAFKKLTFSINRWLYFCSMYVS